MKGCAFDSKKADFVVEFVENVCTHVEGRVGPYILEPYEKAILGCLYGWQITIVDECAERTIRRYREVFVLIGRKNGKTMLAAAVVLFELFFGKEPGAKLFSMAGKKDQASLVFDTASAMLRNKPGFRRLCQINNSWYQIIRLDPKTFDKINISYKALPTDADTSHGLNPHLFINDELHAQRSPLMTSAMESATGARDQPIAFNITTQDYDRPNSVCLTKYKYACAIRDRVSEDHTFLPVIFEARPTDNPGSPKTWAKANPKLGIIPPLRLDLEAAYRKALPDPTAMQEFKRTRLNLITQTKVGMFDIEQWDRCAEMLPHEKLVLLPCWGGLDWSLTSDLTAWIKLFRDEDRYYIVPHFWVAGEMSKRYPMTMVHMLRDWTQRGFIEKSIGPTVNYAQVKAKILRDSVEYDLKEVAADPNNCQQMLQDCEAEGCIAVQIRQTIPSLNEPCKQLLKCCAEGSIAHGGNPVLRWMALNTEAKYDHKGDMMPTRSDDRSQKIDGIVATIIAMARAMVRGSQDDGASVYDTRGVVTL